MRYVVDPLRKPFFLHLTLYNQNLRVSNSQCPSNLQEAIIDSLDSGFIFHESALMILEEFCGYNVAFLRFSIANKVDLELLGSVNRGYLYLLRLHLVGQSYAINEVWEIDEVWSGNFQCVSKER